MAAVVLDERFEAGAPPERVWRFLLDPRRVIGCVPGGVLDRVQPDGTYDGSVRVAVGPLTLAYAGRVRLAAVDASVRRVTIVGEARERGGPGAARLALESDVREASPGRSAVAALVRLDVAGLAAELGRGLLEELGHLVFQEFAAAVRAAIEAEEAGAVPAPRPAAPLRAVPLVLRALRAWLAGLLAARLRRPAR